ncbi:MAG: class I SAM-dependent methyltransferase [Brevinematales bacterium]|nr:class I SAM-dependent methyltransferase [Brevinematales bacterium]
MERCPSCGNEINDNEYIRDYFSEEIKVNYKLYHCPKCEMEFWAPLEFVRSIYEEEVLPSHSYTREIGSFGDLSPNHKYFVKRFMKRLKGDISSNKLLDVGCATGSFIKYMEKEGFEVFGIDIDPKSIEFAKTDLMLKNVYSLSLEEFVDYSVNNDLKFDVITCFEVLEHQTTPLEFLSQVRQILNENGIFLGTVPNRERAFVEMTRSISKSENYDFPPHHFLWLSAKSLKTMLERNGFECLVEETKVDYSTYADRISNLMYFLTKIKIFDSDYVRSLNQKSLTLAIAKVIRYALIYPVTFFAKHIYEAMGGFGLFFYCKKR